MKSQSNRENDSRGIIGVWQVKEVARQGDSGTLADKPFPSIFIFTRRYYSMVWVFGAEPQRPFAERWNPTDAEKIERFNSMVVNSGTYKVKGNTLIAHPVVARIPDFMNGKLLCEYHIEEDTMRLEFVDEYSFDGVQAPWVASGGLVLTLARIE
jgi:hypothetical protein